MLVDLNRYWYRPSLHAITGALLPLSWLFGSVAAMRRCLFRMNIIKSERVAVPVIVVGNITVGGTGKTPFVIWLARFLQEQGYHPGIISRGVGGSNGRKSHYVQLDDPASRVGDEALLIAQKTQCPVVINVDRVAAANTLLLQDVCDIIISDDGLQHYRLERDIEIALVDGVRRFGNKRLLPAGPLREPISRLANVDMVIVNGGHEADEFSLSLEPSQLMSLLNQSQQSLSDFRGQTVHAVAGIGHPSAF